MAYILTEMTETTVILGSHSLGGYVGGNSHRSLAITLDSNKSSVAATRHHRPLAPLIRNFFRGRSWKN